MNAIDVARRFIGTKEIQGPQHNGFISWCLSLCGYGTDAPDEIPWCSAFANGIAFICGSKRSKSAAARSWLNVGDPVGVSDARPGDIVVLKRGEPPSGHVAFFVAIESDRIRVIGGNQSNAVTETTYPLSSLLGVRRIE